MRLSHILRIAAAAAACAAVAAQPALAGGEPKNGLPFTHAAGGRQAPTAVVNLTSEVVRARLMIVGEPRNEPPFTNDALGRFLHTK